MMSLASDDGILPRVGASSAARYLNPGYHLISLGLGGSPTDPLNLWPEPLFPPDGWTAAMKDELEAVLPRLVCAGALTLRQAQDAIETDWREAYRKYVRPGG